MALTSLLQWTAGLRPCSILGAIGPPPLSVVGPEQLLIPDSPSEQVKLTVTFVLFQPFAFAAGARLPEIVGAVLSNFTTTDPVPELPTWSLAVDVFVTPAVSAVTLSVAGVGPDPMPDPASVAPHVIVAFDLLQPAAFGAGDTAPVTAGAVLSRM